MDTQAKIKDFIGTGIILPISIVNGKVPIVGGVELLRASIISIISWEYGKRFFLNEFGSKINQLLEEPNDDILETTIQVFVIEAITNWDKRIEIKDVSINRGYTNINITVNYQISSIKKEDTFTFPFYPKIIY